MKIMLRLELFKIFKRPRTYISFGIVAAIALVIELAMYADGKNFINFALQGINEQFDLRGNILNGYLITYIILQTLLVQIPLLVALVAGDAIAGEASMGTLRLLLTKPQSRSKVIIVKFVASLCYALLLLLWLAIVALGLSVLIFGAGDMINLKSDAMVIILKDDVLWRYIAAFAFAALAMATVAALALLLSCFADNSIGPIVGTMGIIIVLMIFSTLDLPIFSVIKQYLFTTHMVGWKAFFDDPVPYKAVGTSAMVLLVYTFLFLGASIVWFNKKDIQS
ncbi:MAG: ABC transporter permease subunit [Bacteroidetes bacterium]|nr:ABC transporter permease subunit [Bacteroidota bacterium]